jgi:hypothetical protein
VTHPPCGGARRSWARHPSPRPKGRHRAATTLSALAQATGNGDSHTEGRTPAALRSIRGRA